MGDIFNKGLLSGRFIYALVVPEQCQARMHVDAPFQKRQGIFSDAKSLNVFPTRVNKDRNS